MTKQEFGVKIGTYWGRVGSSPEVHDEILNVVASAPDAALGPIYEKLKEKHTPARLLGVSDIYEAAREAGAALRMSDRRSHEVECDCCGSKFHYSQGAVDICPRCKFPYSDYLQLQDYKKAGRMPQNLPETYEKKRRMYQDSAGVGK